MRILLVEDQKRISRFIERGLKEEKYIVDSVYNGEDGLHLALTSEYDLVILDIMLPIIDGITVCKRIREAGNAVPVLLLTAKSDVKDKVVGLDAGADDYLTKPFAFEELAARVRALLRKHRKEKKTTLQYADITLDQLTRVVRRHGEEIELANKEYALLEYFMLHTNEVVTRTMIAEHVWHESFDRLSNVFDVYIHRLRSKIDRDFDKPLIHSVRGVGYVMKDEG